MKKTILITTLCAVVIIITGSFIAVNSKHNEIKENVKKSNPEVSAIESIRGVGGWMEPTSEYTLVVIMGGQTYRVWTRGDGELLDKVVIE
ncbi:hypothetical protein [Ornithinibacillus halophilus]|uniref:Uncharacterized protein n=1 Tax=Ornithinibacillus halophilus TaxID=930117 RepID=A0A1M5JXK4_9BACI|nr:hypothetical protein [Ornithinibacillus halophilus]SHG45271.1 hypothetical protein SAMN05216225_103414 [Ornithinibacillus halophilus]